MVVITEPAFNADGSLAPYTKAPTIVRKTADQIVNNSATFVNDTRLLLAMAANEVWVIDLILYYVSGSATPDIRVQATIPSGVASWIAWGLDAADAIYVYTRDVPNYPTFGTSTILRLARVTFTVVNGATAGNFQIQWCQNTATAEDTKVLTNSCLIAHKLA